MPRKKLDPATQYARDVTKGKIVAGKLVKLACARHLRDLEEQKKRGLVWRPEIAEHVYTFFSCLKLSGGQHSDTPFNLTPFQKFVVGCIFGWYGIDGYRRFRTAYIETGKGSGKTPLAAGIGLYGLTADGEHAAEVYSAAVGRDQAKICFQDCVNFVESNPTLSKKLEVGQNNIAYPATQSFLRPVSSEGRGLDGKRVHMSIVDELHEHPSAIVVDKMRAGTKGRRQALIFEITNSGYDRNSVCYHHHKYSTEVLEGIKEDDSWFAYISALDDGDDPLEDESCWIKANPNLGITITEKYLREQVREAKGMPTKRNIVLRLNFCMWTEQATRWLPLEAWDEVTEPVTPEGLIGRECFGGLDLATTTDVTALAWLFPPIAEGELWKLLMRFWVPADNIRQRVQRDGVPYDLWAQQGFIQTTPGNVVDYAWIRSAIQQDAEKFRVKEIAYDRYNASSIVTNLMDDGFTMVPFGQGFVSMNGPSKEFEKLVMSRQLAHGKNPVLRWMAGNAAANQDPAGNIKPDKAKSTEKIDGIVAAVMALGRATASQEAAPAYQLMIL